MSHRRARQIGHGPGEPLRHPCREGGVKMPDSLIDSLGAACVTRSTWSTPRSPTRSGHKEEDGRREAQQGGDTQYRLRHKGRKLAKIDISTWLTSLYINGMDSEEIAYFTRPWSTPGTGSYSTGPRSSTSTARGVPGNQGHAHRGLDRGGRGPHAPQDILARDQQRLRNVRLRETFCDVELDATR